VREWLGEQFAAFRDAIKIVVIDPSAPYASGIRAALPDVKIAVDKWHLVALANPIYPGKRDLDCYVAGLAAKEGWRRMVAPATMAAPACSTINSVRARSKCQGEEHTRSDRVHAAGHVREPAMQLRTDFLIGAATAARPLRP
jgi:hypothetical protein